MTVRRALAVVAALVLGALACDSNGSGTNEERAGKPDAEASERAGVQVVTYNVLHGLFCPAETDFCQAPDRVEVLVRHLEAAGCPDLVGLQEVGARQEELIGPALEDTCDGTYEIAWEGERVDSPDREMVLTRLPIVERGYLDIANFPWEAYWVRVESDAGPVDFLTAHFASSSNNPPCDATRCPAICPVGLVTNECHALEVVDFFDRRPEPAALSVVAGDLNATPGSPTITTLTGAGFVDAWLEAGNPECDRATEAGCTGGGGGPEETVLDGTDTIGGRDYSVRIDFLLVRPGRGCEPRFPRTAGFADEPLAEPVNGLYWASDHVGVQATLACR
ncbi:MAG: endonuclease/exonuclease/phosphatase family protein [Acidimicrobiia bacterium]